jgi:hypothetical protein
MNDLDKRSSLELARPLPWVGAMAFAAGFGGYLALTIRCAGI